MKRIKTRLLALLLSCCLVTVGTVTPCRQTQAAEIVAGMETIQWILSIGASVGITISISDLLGKPRDDVRDWDNYDWGNLLDDPATQKQIDETDKKIEEYYNNAVKDWYVKHGGQLSPSPAPTTKPQPPVTVAPIDPDTVEPPIDWDTLKKNTKKTGVLSMMGATLACMRDGLAAFWDDVIGSLKIDETSVDPLTVSKIKSGGYPYYFTYYNKDNKSSFIVLYGVGSFLDDSKQELRYVESAACYRLNGEDKYSKWSYSKYSSLGQYSYKYLYSNSYSNIVTNLPHFSDTKSGEEWSEKQRNKKKIPKAAIIPDLTQKQAYDNNSSIGDSTSSGSGSSPGSNTDKPFNFKIPTIDEIKDFLKDLMGGDENDQPTKVTNFITNHMVQPTPAPNPTTAPNPGGGESGGGSIDPDNPDSGDTDLDNYKADLRDVFPFCIPFDLIHLLNVLDAEPEAPVFKIPIDLEAGNPFTGDKIVDYHSEMVIDLSDYDDAIKVIRILEIIAFLLGLMLITRQQMIKG